MKTKAIEENEIHRAAAEALFIAVIVMVSVLFLSACSTSPKGRKQLTLLPDDQMAAMGAQAFQDLKAKTPASRDPAQNAYVKCVANAITEVAGATGGRLPKTWEVVVFQDDSANAFALPGGKIGVYTGLLKVAQTPAQLATVLGHEVGHVIAEHGNERVSEQLVAQGGLAALSIAMQDRGDKYNGLMAAIGLGAQFGVLLPHSRAQESEADLIGLDLMAKAGFDPSQSVELWKNMAATGGGQPPEFLSTHPSHGKRIENLRANIPRVEELYRAAARKPACQKTS